MFKKYPIVCLPESALIALSKGVVKKILAVSQKTKAASIPLQVKGQVVLEAYQGAFFKDPIKASALAGGSIFSGIGGGILIYSEWQKNAAQIDLANAQRILAEIQARQALTDAAAGASDVLGTGAGL